MLQPEAELGDSDSDAGSDENKQSKRKKKLESRLKIAELKQVQAACFACLLARLLVYTCMLWFYLSCLPCSGLIDCMLLGACLEDCKWHYACSS